MRKVLVVIGAVIVGIYAVGFGAAALGFHGDNYSPVVITGRVVDGETGEPLEGVEFGSKYWTGGNEFSESFANDPHGADLLTDGQTGADGEFEVEQKLFWAVYPIPFWPSWYGSFELFFRKDGYEVAVHAEGGVRVKKSQVPGQVIDLGDIPLTAQDQQEASQGE